MLSKGDIRQGLASAIRTLRFDVRGPDSTPADWPTAWRSFYTLLFLLPVALAMTWQENIPYFIRYGADPQAYLAARLAGMLVALPLSILASWLLARSQDAGKGFPAYLTAGNWFAVVSTFVFFPFWLLSDGGDWLPDHTRTTIGICLYVLGLVYGWFIAWRTLKINPFFAAGFAVLGSAISTTIADYINIEFFGVARPFFDQMATVQ